MISAVMVCGKRSYQSADVRIEQEIFMKLMNSVGQARDLNHEIVTKPQEIFCMEEG